MKIGRREIGPGQPTFILAEAGTNHLGDVRKAIALVKAAYLAGCDGIKFQLFVKDEPLFCPMEGDERRRERWNRSAMDWGEWQTVREYAADKRLAFVLSVFQDDGIDLANKLEIDAFKVASRAHKTFPYAKCDGCDGPFIISYGFDDEVNTLFRKFGEKDVLHLECESQYPTPLEDALQDAYSITHSDKDGLSDHSGTPWPGICAALDRVWLVEVHFAIDKADAGPDAPVCLTPDQLELICEARDAAAEM